LSTAAIQDKVIPGSGTPGDKATASKAPRQKRQAKSRAYITDEEDAMDVDDVPGGVAQRVSSTDSVEVVPSKDGDDAEEEEKEDNNEEEDDEEEARPAQRKARKDRLQPRSPPCKRCAQEDLDCKGRPGDEVCEGCRLIGAECVPGK
jgi:hypothetical protein